MLLQDGCSPSPDRPLIAPSALYPDAWHAIPVDEDPGCRNKLARLAVLTQARDVTVDTLWIRDEVAILQRWQHVVEGLGTIALDYRHPHFEGLSDKPETELVRTALDYTFEHIHTDGMTIPALAFMFCRIPDDPQPEVFDLRDMHEPEEVLGDIDFATFQRLSPKQRQALRSELEEWLAAEYYGGKGLISPIPQIRLSADELMKFQLYTSLL